MRTIKDMTVSEIFTELNDSDKDALYRMLWSDYVYKDVLNYSIDIDKELNENGVEDVVNDYIYNGKYDCNLSYWDNLENLINEAYENKEYRAIENERE